MCMCHLIAVLSFELIAYYCNIVCVLLSHSLNAYLRTYLLKGFLDCLMMCHTKCKMYHSKPETSNILEHGRHPPQSLAVYPFHVCGSLTYALQGC